MSTLRAEIGRWEADLQSIADASLTDNWLLEERRFAEAQHTLTAFRARILPALAASTPHDSVVAGEIEHLLDTLEDLRNDLYRTVHPPTSHLEIAETIAALRALARVAQRFEQTPAERVVL